MQHTDVPAGWLTIAQAAKALRVSKQTVRRYAAGGLLVSHDTPTGVVLRATDVMRFSCERNTRSAS